MKEKVIVYWDLIMMLQKLPKNLKIIQVSFAKSNSKIGKLDSVLMKEIPKKILMSLWLMMMFPK